MNPFEFDVYNFYTRGYTVGFLPEDIVNDCRNILNKTEWHRDEDESVSYPEWMLLPDDNGTDEYYQEITRELQTLNTAPPEIKYIGDRILHLPYFDKMKQILVKDQHKDYTWMRTFVPNGFGVWDGQETLQWHTDINDSNDITILAYFTDNGIDWDKSWNGQLLLGVKDENGDIQQVHEHHPVDGTFVVINNTNPLFQHRVIQNLKNTTRYTMSFRYCIK